MLRHQKIWGFLSALLVTASTLAQPQTHQVQVSVQEPSCLSYRLKDSAVWVDLGQAHGTKNFEIPNADLEIRLFQDHGLYSIVDTAHVSPGISSRLEFRQETAQRVPAWPRLFGLFGGLCLAIILFYRRRLKTVQSLGGNLEPLIRPDGRVPKRKLGQYQLTEILGTGGMGVVYRAQGDDGHAVAIKVPTPHLIAQNDFRERFLREIKLGIQLRHPRLVQVLEMPLGEELYVVMEFVQGTPLDRYPVQPWSVEWKQCVEWAAQVLDALHYIHGQGIIHRDLKPANLIVQPDQSLKLMDFGIAHVVDGTRLTGTGCIMGTLTYMAPEQLQGHPMDHRCDLYALGLILYERLLPGLPFSEDPMEAAREKMARPLTPLGEFHPHFPERLDAFLQKLTAQQANDRFANAAEALAFLDPIRPRKATPA